MDPVHDVVTFAVIGMVAFAASALTLYSGFGLGTILLAAFSIFFPVPVAVAATAVVHLINNLFKGLLLARQADWRIVLRFGLPAIPAAVAGAWVLVLLGESPTLFEWTALRRVFGPTAAGLTVGSLMIILAVLELQPWFQRLAAPPRLLPVGGMLTGFLGGLTGQQGALRSVFLLRSGLAPGGFIATGVVIAVLVDISRIPTYVASLDGGQNGGADWALVAFATLCACAGALVASRYLHKATIAAVRIAVAALMLAIGVALMAGVLGSP